MLCLAKSLCLGKVFWAGSSAVALTRDAHFLWQPCLFAGLRIIAPDLLEVRTEGRERGLGWRRAGICLV